MRWIIALALRHRITVVILGVLAVLASPALLRHVPLDVFPEFAPPLVEVQTEAPGLSSDEVESLVTIPMENALLGTSWVANIQSKSVLGLSSVVLYFPLGTDPINARQLVQERVGRVAATLPAVAEPPVILSPLSSASRAMLIGLRSDSMSQMELTTLAKWVVRPKLMSVPGVANVAIWGQRDRQLQVQVDPDRLRANGLTLDQVVEATREATAVGGGGFVDTPNQRFAVTHRTPLGSAADLAKMVAAYRDGTPVTLGDIAVVTEGYPAPIGDAVINDEPGLLLVVEKQPWGNTLAVTYAVEDALREIMPALKGVEVDARIFRAANFVEMAIGNLGRALLIGCLLVVMVLAAFLRDWRTGLISVVAIPLSLVAAALLLRWRGDTINTMVLAGLVLALGEVVDDAIIDVENIARRLRLNRGLAEPRPTLEVVLHASLEVRSAVLYGSMLVILVFLPVFFLPGLAGVFFKPLAASYILAIVASLLVALTITPALALLLLDRGEAAAGETRLVHWLKEHYRVFLPRLVDRPRVAVRTLAGAMALAAIAYLGLGSEFLPKFREYDFMLHWVEKPGVSIDGIRRVTEKVSRELRSIPGVRHFGAQIGRAEEADEIVGPNFSELWISADPTVDYDATVARIQGVVDGYPGMYKDVLTHLRERIKEVLTGEGASIVVRVSGPDLATLRDQATLIRDSIARIPGVIDLKVQAQTLVPQVEVRFRPEAAARFGVTSAEVQSALSTLVRGTTVGQFYEGQKAFDVAVWSVPEVRQDPSSLSRLLLDTPAGQGVPLGAVADVVVVPALNEITREGATRKLDVSCNVRGRDLGSVAQDIEGVLARLPFPPEHHASILGEYAERKAAASQLLGLAAIALAGIVLLLYNDFDSLRLTLMAVVSLPFAMIGGVAAVWLTGGVLSLGSLVGFVTVLGIAGRNGIMLISHYRHLEQQEGVPFGREMVLRGADERLVPILMTAGVTALALVPIILGGDRPGHEIEVPMAVVIVGGLVTSTILNLFLMPALYLRYGRASAGQGVGGG